MLTNIIDFSSIFVLIIVLGNIIKRCVNSSIFVSNEIMLDMDEKIDELKNIHPVANAILDTETISKNLNYSRISAIFSWFKVYLTSPIKNLIFIFCLFPAALFGLQNWELTSNFPIWANLFILLTGWNIFNLIVDIPFDLYDDKIEKKFGFSNMTNRLYFMDCIKGFLVNTVISFLAIYGFSYVFSFLHTFGQLNLITGCSLVGVCLFFNWLFGIIYTCWIDPLFNKYTPIEDGELKTKLKNLVEGMGYKFDNVYIMDESRRSNRSNAYCLSIPFGPHKIVIYDTLLKQLSIDEIVAIFAHEYAHKRFYHGYIGNVTNAISNIFSVAVMILFMYNIEFYHALGFTFINDQNVNQYALVGVYLSGILIESVAWIFTPILAALGRYHEYIADKFGAKYIGNVEDMITALIKIHVFSGDVGVCTNMFEKFFCGHPSLINRIKALQKIKGE